MKDHLPDLIDEPEEDQEADTTGLLSKSRRPRKEIDSLRLIERRRERNQLRRQIRGWALDSADEDDPESLSRRRSLQGSAY
jgi:hypothetical protein